MTGAHLGEQLHEVVVGESREGMKAGDVMKGQWRDDTAEDQGHGCQVPETGQYRCLDLAGERLKFVPRLRARG